VSITSLGDEVELMCDLLEGHAGPHWDGPPRNIAWQQQQEPDAEITSTEPQS
jgi:hypothetical protein